VRATGLALVVALAVVTTTGVPVASAATERDPAYCRSLRPKVAELQETLMSPGAVVLVRSPKLGDCFVSVGTRNLETDRRIGLHDQFRIGSNTKTMTGTAILQLVQEGKLRLDDPVSKHVDGVPNGEDITIEQLLNMRSGLADYSALPELAQSMDQTPQRVWTPAELLALSYAQPPAFTPGDGYLYANANTVLLGLIAEEVTGQPLSKVLDQRVFRPLGLRRTELPVRKSNVIPQAHAQGYMYGSVSEFLVDGGVFTPEERAAADDGTLEPRDVTDMNPSWAWAAGAAISTTDDLARYVRALVRGGLLNKKMQRQRLASVIPIDPDKPDGTAYGEGIVFYENKLYGHTGELPGFNSFMGHDPKRDLTIVAWANSIAGPDGRGPADALSLMLIDELYPS
jgi:D-alanyl-D-alanine carboxypeptidase